MRAARDVTDDTLSIILVSSGSLQALERSLGLLADVSCTHAWELYVVLPVGRLDLGERLKQLERTLPLKGVINKTSSTNEYLFNAMELSRGQTLSILGDQVRINQQWFHSISRGSRDYPTALVLCGAVDVHFRSSVPDWLKGDRFSGINFGQFETTCQEGLLDTFSIPSGINCTFRQGALLKALLSTKRYSKCLGHSEVVRELIGDIVTTGERIIYVNGARLTYDVAEEEVNLANLLDGAFYYGRVVASTPDGLLIYSTRWLIDNAYDSAEEFYEWGMLLNLYIGQLSRHSESQRHHACRFLLSRIASLGWNGEESALSRSASEWVRLGRGYADQVQKAFIAQQ